MSDASTPAHEDKTADKAAAKHPVAEPAAKQDSAIAAAIGAMPAPDAVDLVAPASHDPFKRLARVAIDAAEKQLVGKQPANSNVDPTKAPLAGKQLAKADDAKHEDAAADHKVDSDKPVDDAADHATTAKAGEETLHAATADAKHEVAEHGKAAITKGLHKDDGTHTLDAHLAQHEHPTKKPGLVDGHGTGLELEPTHKHGLTVDGHGTGLELDGGHGKAKPADGHLVDGHGTGLDLGPTKADPANHHDADHGGGAAHDGDEHIVDSDGQTHTYNPASGKAPAPKENPAAHAGGFAKPKPHAELPPPPQTANQTLLNSFIEKARADRDAAKGQVQHAQLAKSAQVSINANQIAAQVKAKNDTKLATIRKQADADKAKAAAEAAAKQQAEGPVTIESLKAKLEANTTEDKSKLKTEHDAKVSELKTRIESQKAVLLEQTNAQIENYKKQQAAKKADAEKSWKDQQVKLEQTRDKLLTEIRKNTDADRVKLEREMQKDGKLWLAANAKMEGIERDWKANKQSAHDNGYNKATALEAKANGDAAAERRAGHAAAATAAAGYNAKLAAEDADVASLKAQQSAAANAAQVPHEQRARDLETKAKLDGKAMRTATDTQAAKIEDDGKKAKEAVNTATAGQVKAIEGKIQDLGKIADGKIKKAEEDLKAKLAEGEKQLATVVADTDTKIAKLKADGDAKIAKVETEATTKLQKDYDAALAAIDKRVEAARKQLATGSEKNIKQLAAMVDQTCKAIDKTVSDTEKKFEHTVLDADKQAQAFVLAQLHQIKAEADKALHAIDKNYEDALKKVDDAVAATHKQLEDTAKGKMLEIEVHVGTMLNECGDGTRLGAAKSQLEYYIKNKLPIPTGYGEAPPPSEKAKEYDDAKAAKPGDKTAKPAGPEEKKEEPGAEAAKLKAEDDKRASLLKEDNLTPEGINAKVEEAVKKGQKQTGAGADDEAKHSLKVSYAAATDSLTKTFDTKSNELEKLKAGDTEMLKQVHDQQHHEEEGEKAATRVASAMDQKGFFGGKSPDKKAIMQALEGKTPEEIEAMREALKAKGIKLDEFIDKEMSGDQQKEARIRMKGDPIAGDIAALTSAGGHHMTGNEKLLVGMTGTAGIIFFAANGDQNVGVDKARMQEIIAKYQGPEHEADLLKLKEAYEKQTGRPFGELLHETGQDAAAKKLGVEVKPETRSKEDVQKGAQADAEKIYLDAQKDPAKAGKISPEKCVKAVGDLADALQGFHLDSTAGENVRAALANCSPEEMAYVKALYKQKTGRDLDHDMEKRLSGPALAESKAVLRNDKETAAVNKILGAEDSSWTPWTVDDKKMNDTLKELKDPAERRAVLEAYEKRTGRKLQDVIAEKMTGNDRDLATALADGDQIKARMVELDEATNGGWMNGMHKAIHDRTKQATGADIDTESFTRPLASALISPVSDPNQTVTLPGGYVMEGGSIHKVDSDKIFELLEATPNPADRQKLKDLYFQKTGRTLDDDMGTKLVGPMGGQSKLDAYKALDDGRMDDYAAAKMDDAVDGLNDSKAFHKQLEGKSAGERKRIVDAYNRRHPNTPDAFNVMIDDQFGADSMDKKKAQLLATSADDPRTGAVKLPDKFVLEYAQDSVWNRAAKNIDGATAIFEKYPILYAVPIVGTSAAELKAASYFMRGWGVDNDAIKEVLKGKSKDDIDKLKAQYPELEKDLMYAMSGRDAFEVKLMLDKGEPKTDKERIERKMALYEFDRTDQGSWLGTSALSNGITDAISPSGKLMDDEYARMKAQLEVIKKGGGLDPAAQRQLDIALGNMDSSSKHFLEAREEVTGAIATAVGAVVGAVVTVLTGGVAGAILAALATGAATMATKVVMLGQAYGRNEMGVDLAMTAVQMATAGMGGGISKLSESFMVQVLNGAIGAAASNFAQTAITSKDAHDLLGLLAQASKSGLVGLLSGGANAAATAGLANAMGKLSEKAFGPNAPLAGIMMKGFVSGAGGSIAGTFAEAMVDGDTLAGNWDVVFAKLARGAAEAGMQNGLSEVASAHHERTSAVHERAKVAVEEVQKKNGGNRNLQEEHAAFAKAMSEGYTAVIADQEAAAKAAKAKQEAPTPDEALAKAEQPHVAPKEELPAKAEEPHPGAKDEKLPNGKTAEEVKAHMDEVAKGAPLEEKGPVTHEEPKGKKIAGDETDFGAVIEHDPGTKPKKEGWEPPKSDEHLSPEEREHKAAVDERKKAILDREPKLDPIEAERRARNDVLHGIDDAKSGPVKDATRNMSEAIKAGNGEAAVAALEHITDLSASRELVMELRKQNGGAPLETILANLPPEQAAAVKKHLDGLRADPALVEHSQKMLSAQEEAQRNYDEVANKHSSLSEADVAARSAAEHELVNARQKAIDAICDAYGVDDSQVAQRKPTDRMGYGLERGSMGATEKRGSSVAEAMPDGHIQAKNDGHGAGHALFVDENGQPRSPGFIAAALSHEVQHIEQLRGGRYTNDSVAPGQHDVGTAINEAEAYKHMIDKAEKFGLTPKEVAWAQERYNGELAKLQASDPAAAERVKNGDFSTPGHSVVDAPKAEWTNYGGEKGPGAGDGKMIEAPQPKRAGHVEEAPDSGLPRFADEAAPSSKHPEPETKVRVGEDPVALRTREEVLARIDSSLEAAQAEFHAAKTPAERAAAELKIVELKQHKEMIEASPAAKPGHGGHEEHLVVEPVAKVASAIADEITVRKQISSEQATELVKNPSDAAAVLTALEQFVRSGKISHEAFGEAAAVILGKALEHGLKAAGHEHLAELISKASDALKLGMSDHNPAAMDAMGRIFKGLATGNLERVAEGLQNLGLKLSPEQRMQLEYAKVKAADAESAKLIDEHANKQKNPLALEGDGKIDLGGLHVPEESGVIELRKNTPMEAAAALELQKAMHEMVLAKEANDPRAIQEAQNRIDAAQHAVERAELVVAPPLDRHVTATEKAQQTQEQVLNAKHAEVAELKLQLKDEVDPVKRDALEQKIKKAEEAAVKTAETIANRDKQRDVFLEAHAIRTAEIEQAQVFLDSARAEGDANAIKHWEAHLKQLESSPIMPVPAGHEHIGGVAKAALDKAATPEAREQLEANLKHAYDNIRGRTPADIAHDPVALQHLIEAHLAMHDETMREGNDMRKVMTRDAMEKMLRGVDFSQDATDTQSFSGFVGDSRNTAGLTPHEIVELLGLDYHDTDYVKSGKGGKKEGISSLAVIDTPITAENLPEMKKGAKIPMDPALIKAIEAAAKANPPNEAAKRMIAEGLLKEKALNWHDPENPYAGVGMSTSGSRMTGDEPTAAREKLKINQEKEVVRADAIKVNDGTKLKVIRPDGSELVVATFKVTDPVTGKGSFVLEPELPKILRDRYEHMQEIETRFKAGDITDAQRKDMLKDLTASNPKHHGPVDEHQVGELTKPTVEEKEQSDIAKAQRKVDAKALKAASSGDPVAAAKAQKELAIAQAHLDSVKEVVKIKEEGRQAKQERETARKAEISLARLELEAAKANNDPHAVARAEARMKAAETAMSQPTHAEARARLVEDRKLRTVDAFCTVELPKDYAAARAILMDPKNWTPERQQFHEEVLQRALKDARAMANEIKTSRGEDSDGEPALFAMRGNTAAGKSRSISGGAGPSELAEGVKHTDKGGRSSDNGEELRHRAINPDNFKKEIYEHDPHLGVTSNQAHEESSIMSEWLHQRLLAEQHADGTPVDMVVDKRLAWMDEVQKLIQESKDTGRRMHMIDVDAELSTSFAGVLDRDGVSNPIPPANNIADGFSSVRGNRAETIKLVAAEPTAAYQLFGTTSNGSKVLVAEIKPLANGEKMPANPLERLIVHDEDRFNAITPKDKAARDATTKHAADLQKQPITPELIDEMTKDLKGDYKARMQEVLHRFEGRTWGEAIDYWSQHAAEESKK
ncbi:MAG: hypothetical protein NT062_15970 [Proteobacteria bacterium]|nr:hypothetical protein [Pseudomonadota bacterium]